MVPIAVIYGIDDILNEFFMKHPCGEEHDGNTCTGNNCRLIHVISGRIMNLMLTNTYYGTRINVQAMRSVGGNSL